MLTVLLYVYSTLKWYTCWYCIDQTLWIHRLLNCEIAGLDCHVITTKYRTCVHCIHMYHLFCNALVHVIYSWVSGQCPYTICLLCFRDHSITSWWLLSQVTSMHWHIWERFVLLSLSLSFSIFNNHNLIF